MGNGGDLLWGSQSVLNNAVRHNSGLRINMCFKQRLNCIGSRALHTGPVGHTHPVCFLLLKKYIASKQVANNYISTLNTIVFTVPKCQKKISCKNKCK